MEAGVFLGFEVCFPMYIIQLFDVFILLCTIYIIFQVHNLYLQGVRLSLFLLCGSFQFVRPQRRTIAGKHEVKMLADLEPSVSRSLV